jgi:hypothetical protein
MCRCTPTQCTLRRVCSGSRQHTCKACVHIVWTRDPILLDALYTFLVPSRKNWNNYEKLYYKHDCAYHNICKSRNCTKGGISINRILVVAFRESNQNGHMVIMENSANSKLVRFTWHTYSYSQREWLDNNHLLWHSCQQMISNVTYWCLRRTVCSCFQLHLTRCSSDISGRQFYGGTS